MKADLNHLLTRIGPGAPCGDLMRHYWQPVALVDEFNPALDPRMLERPVKAVRLLGQDLVMFRSGNQWGLLDRDCPHRGADLSFARFEIANDSQSTSLRCPFHGWKFAADGTCLETPGEPTGSTLCQRVRQRSYPVQKKAGILYAWMGPEGSAPPAFPEMDCYAAPASHSFAFKGLWRANWLQAFEVGIDPAHPSFLHRYFEDESTEGQFGKQFRGASAGEVDGTKWPMTRVMRECQNPEIRFAPAAHGLEITTLRPLSSTHTHVRVTQAVFPHIFVIPLSETITITQCHVPVDDVTTYWYTIFTSYAEPLDQAEMRRQRLQSIDLPDYIPRAGAHNRWGHDAQEQRTQTYLGMGQDINVHDQWAIESMGAIADRTREHLGTTDKVIMAYRRNLQKAIETVQAGGKPPMALDAASAASSVGPRTHDGIENADDWANSWQIAESRKRAQAPWQRAAP